MPRAACSRRPAIACASPGRPWARRRCAAAAPSWRPAWSKAKSEARRLLQALLPFVAKGVPVVGLEPSCLFTLRDEFLAMGLGEDAQAVCDNAFLFEEFLVREKKAGRLELALKPLPQKRPCCTATATRRRSAR